MTSTPSAALSFAAKSSATDANSTVVHGRITIAGHMTQAVFSILAVELVKLIVVDQSNATGGASMRVGKFGTRINVFRGTDAAAARVTGRSSGNA